MTGFDDRDDLKVDRTNHTDLLGFGLQKQEGWGCGSKEAPADGSKKNGHQRSAEESG